MSIEETKKDLRAGEAPLDPERSKAAAVLGRKGGMAGTGAAKRRSPAAIKRAVKARIAANRARKAQA